MALVGLTENFAIGDVVVGINKLRWQNSDPGGILRIEPSGIQ